MWYNMTGGAGKFVVLCGIVWRAGQGREGRGIIWYSMTGKGGELYGIVWQSRAGKGVV